MEEQNMYKVLIVEKITYVSKLINGRDICLTLQTFMKSLANTNKPAEGTFITLESENSSWPFMSWIVTESQNHRMVGLGRDFCGSPSPTLLPKQGHLQQAAQDLVQAGLEYLEIHEKWAGPTILLWGRGWAVASQGPFLYPLTTC